MIQWSSEVLPVFTPALPATLANAYLSQSASSYSRDFPIGGAVGMHPQAHALGRPGLTSGEVDPRLSDVAATDFAFPGNDDRNEAAGPAHPRKRARDETTRSRMSYPRKRAVRACQVCRTRKMKCNNARPICGACRDAGAQCVYEDSMDHSAWDPASLTMLDRLDQIIQCLNTHIVPGPYANNQARDRNPYQALGVRSGGDQLDISPASYGLENGHDKRDRDLDMDYLHIPTSQTTADQVLEWPVFAGRYPVNCLVGNLSLVSQEPSNVQALSSAGVIGLGVADEDIEDLVERFLTYVHTKNPILDPKSIRRSARRVAEDGLKWDAESCLIYIACALGCFAKPFQLRDFDWHEDNTVTGRAKEDHRNDLCRAESYYNLARRRIGILVPSIITAQCYFFSAVYLMHVVKPLQAWQNFHQASTICHLLLSFNTNKPDGTVTADMTSPMNRLEQCLYWSCFKSECEMRVEITLPASAVSDMLFPDLFPSPPDEYGLVAHHEASTEETSQAKSPPDSGIHSKRQSIALHNQTQSWYYYLTEIALRRLGNRVLNRFYKESFHSWSQMDVARMMRSAEDFQSELERWCDRLPGFLQYDRENLHIRPENEFSFLLRARVCEIQSWITRPFLFYAIHHPSSTENAMIRPFVEKCLYLAIIHIENIQHRHRFHGIWLALRCSTAAAFILIGAVKCGHLSLQVDWSSAIRTHISTLRYWEEESPDIPETISVLETMLEEVKTT